MKSNRVMEMVASMMSSSDDLLSLNVQVGGSALQMKLGMEGCALRFIS